MTNELLTFQSDLIEHLPLILSGLLGTLQLAGTVTLTGLLGGFLLLYFKISEHKLTRGTTEAYISFLLARH